MNDKCSSCGTPKSLKESTRTKYDDQWKNQDEEAAANRRKSLSMVADPLISMVQPLSGKVVVDLGIGTGSLAFRAMEISPPKQMIGVDFSRPGLCVARNVSRHSRFKDMDFEGIIADLERLPIGSKSVDVVLSQATINLLPDKCSALKEVARIAKSGARVAVSDAFKTSHTSDEGSWEQCIGGAVTVAEFSTLCMNAGLIIAGQVDLTKQVKTLVSAKKWDWPEFIHHNMDYRGFLLLKS
ncbi:MAG TPA: methyltransferase domain-containing protein [Thermoplasmata archaeon]